MASPRVSALLALEIESWSPGTAKNRSRNSGTYPQALTRESSVGHATYQSRTPLPLRERRQVVHFNVTEHPTAAWTAQQMIVAFPEDTVPRHLIRDRDSIYGDDFRRRVAGMRIEEVITAPHSPWQNAYAERVIGSIRRECLDHVIVLSEGHLRRILKRYSLYYHNSRPHQALDQNAPIPRTVESGKKGSVISIPEVGGLHHRHQRAA
jgi:putative transposase